jgi:hypothetical protein
MTQQSNKSNTNDMLRDECKADQFLALIKREAMYSSSAPRKPGKLSGLSAHNTDPYNKNYLFCDSNDEHTVMREKICKWMYAVVDYCNYDRKITFIG